MVPEDWDVDYSVNLAANHYRGKKHARPHSKTEHIHFSFGPRAIERINSYSYEGEAVLTAAMESERERYSITSEASSMLHQRVYRISDFNPRMSGYFLLSLLQQPLLQPDNADDCKVFRRFCPTRNDSEDDRFLSLPKPNKKPLPPSSRDMDAEIAALEAKLAKARQIKQGMMQELLTGRIRLV